MALKAAAPSLRSMQNDKPTLEELLEAAKSHEATPEERDEQIVSFAYGNTHLHNPLITKEMVRSELQKLKETEG